MGDFKEVDKIFIETSVLGKDNESGRYSFLKIALFDIWMCNEDRHFENFNLLYDLKKNTFVPIDHVFCFNSMNLDKLPYLISNNESLLSSPFLNRFFDRNLQSRSNEIRLEILEEFEHNVKCCYDELDKILSDTPLAWEPNPGYLKSRLETFFSSQWLKDCRNYFTKLYFINIKSN